MKTSGMSDVKRWVISYGADAMVIEPEKLKKEIVKELAVAKENYKNPRREF
ncbi:MAG: WYL domain-containing protein [Nitrospirae bacterium]|nr:WYL domain-containing protein [Nitrospirota bacterium]